MASSRKKASPAKTRRTKKGKHTGFLGTIFNGALAGTGTLGGHIHNRLFPGLKYHSKKHHKENVEYYKTILEDGGAVGGAMSAGTGGFSSAANPAGPVAGVDTFLGKKPKSKAADTIQPDDDASPDVKNPTGDYVREAYLRNLVEKIKGKGNASARIPRSTAAKVGTPPPHEAPSASPMVEAKLLKKSIIIPKPLDEPKVDFSNVQNGDGRQI